MTALSGYFLVEGREFIEDICSGWVRLGWMGEGSRNVWAAWKGVICLRGKGGSMMLLNGEFLAGFVVESCGGAFELRWNGAY